MNPARALLVLAVTACQPPSRGAPPRAACAQPHAENAASRAGQRGPLALRGKAPARPSAEAGAPPVSAPDVAAASAPDVAVASTPDVAAASAPDVAVASTPDVAAASAPDVAAASAPDVAAASVPPAPWSVATVDADSLSSLRSDLLREVGHSIALELAPGRARLVVRRDFFNGGPRADQATLHVMLPEGATATGLRTLGAVDGKPHWWVGELLEAEAAAARYRELTGIGGYYPKDPALLSWRHQGHLALQVFPCPPGETKSVEYTLDVPTHYAAGRHTLDLPSLGLAGHPAVVTVRAADARDQLWIDGQRVNAGHTLSLAADHGSAFALVEHAPALLGGAFGEQGVAAGRVLQRYRVEAAPHLSEAPRHAQVVVLLDASRSLDDRDRDQLLAAARGYLAALPDDAEVEIATFDRRAQPRLGRLAPVAEARARLATLALLPANGSHVDAALRLADDVLARARRGVARRVVLLTDAATRASLDVATLDRLVSTSGALVHVGVPGDDGERLARRDDHAFAPWTARTGGVTWSVGEVEPRESARVFTEWVRPVRLHDFAIAGVVVPGEISTLDEGEGVSDLALGALRRGQLRVSGRLWARKVETLLTTSSTEERLTATRVFGSPLLAELSEPEMMPLALLGRAVSPVTSYLAIEPGVRPSTEGLEATGEAGGGRGEGIGLGALGTVGHGAGTTFDPQAWLVAALARALTECGSAAAGAEVQVETTSQEVVDVPRVVAPRASDAHVATCVGELAWRLELPGGFTSTHATWSVRVPS